VAAGSSEASERGEPQREMAAPGRNHVANGMFRNDVCRHRQRARKWRAFNPTQRRQEGAGAGGAGGGVVAVVGQRWR